MSNDVLQIIFTQVLYSDVSQLKKELILKFLYEKVYGVWTQAIEKKQWLNLKVIVH